MKYVIAFILGAVCGIAAFIFLCCVAVGKMAEEEEQRTEVLWCNFEVPNLFRMEDV